MIVLLSPAKTQQFTQHKIETTVPSPFIEESEALVKELRNLTINEICTLMKVKENIAKTTADSFRKWNRHGNDVDSVAAITGFSGPAFKALDPMTLSGDAVEYAKKSLIVLSGLYGVLRAESRFMPYRFEMGLSYKVNGAESLYSYWKPQITEYLDNMAKEYKHSALINIASGEYSKAVDFKKLSVPTITCDFKERKGDKLRSVSSYAKSARGMMARHIFMNSIENSEDLKAFSEEGYAFSEEHSSEDYFCFVR